MMNDSSPTAHHTQSTNAALPVARGKPCDGPKLGILVTAHRRCGNRVKTDANYARKLTASQSEMSALTTIIGTPSLRRDKAVFDRIRQEILLRLKPLVRSSAARIKKATGTSLPTEDLAQEGWVAACQAMESYDVRLGANPATYAHSFLLVAMYRAAMDFHGQLRIATNARDKKVYFFGRSAMAKVEQSQPSASRSTIYEQVAAIIGVPLEVVERMMPRLVAHDASLDATLDRFASPSDGDTDHRRDVTPFTQSATDIENELTMERDQVRIADKVHRAVGAIKSERTRYVIRKRYLGPTVLSYQKIANELHLSKKTVREIELAGRRELMTILPTLGLDADSIGEIPAYRNTHRGWMNLDRYDDLHRA